MLQTLAQSSRGSAPAQVIVWVIVLIVVVLAATGLIYILHRKLFADKVDAVDNEGLMATMRRLKDRGELSQEEFDQAKRALSRRTVEQVEAKLAARQQGRSEASRRDAARAAAQKLIDAAHTARPPGTRPPDPE